MIYDDWFRVLKVDVAISSLPSAKAALPIAPNRILLYPIVSGKFSRRIWSGEPSNLATDTTLFP